MSGVSPQEQINVSPSAKTLEHAAKFALNEDKPIMLDYYVASATGKAFLGEYSESKRKFLFKSNEEYTSDIVRMGKSENDYIFITENSIYICNTSMKKKVVKQN